MSNTTRIQTQNRLQHKRRVHGGIDRRVSAHEEQFQPFIWKFGGQFASGSFPSGVRASARSLRHALVTNNINDMACCCEQPGFGVLRQAVSWPGLERGNERFAEGILSARQVVRVDGKIRTDGVGFSGHALYGRPTALWMSS